MNVWFSENQRLFVEADAPLGYTAAQHHGNWHGSDSVVGEGKTYSLVASVKVAPCKYDLSY